MTAPSASKGTVKIAFDLKLRRPGCVLIQAAMGCVDGQAIVRRIDARLWLVSMTDDMRVYTVPEEEARTLARDCEAWHAAHT